MMSQEGENARRGAMILKMLIVALVCCAALAVSGYNPLKKEEAMSGRNYALSPDPVSQVVSSGGGADIPTNEYEIEHMYDGKEKPMQEAQEPLMRDAPSENAPLKNRNAEAEPDAKADVQMMTKAKRGNWRYMLYGGTRHYSLVSKTNKWFPQQGKKWLWLVYLTQQKVHIYGRVRSTVTFTYSVTAICPTGQGKLTTMVQVRQTGWRNKKNLLYTGHQTTGPGKYLATSASGNVYGWLRNKFYLWASLDCKRNGRQVGYFLARPPRGHGWTSGVAPISYLVDTFMRVDNAEAYV